MVTNLIYCYIIYCSIPLIITIEYRYRIDFGNPVRFMFLQMLFLTFFLILAPLWWFGALGFGVAVLNWFFGIAIFSWWDFGPVVWGQLGFWGPGSLYKHIRLTLGKKFSPESPWGTTFYCLLAASNSISCVLEEIIIYHTEMFFCRRKIQLLLPFSNFLCNRSECGQKIYCMLYQKLKIVCAILRLFIFFQVTCRCFIFICRTYLASQSIMSSDLEQSSQQCLCLRMFSLTHSGLSHLPMCTSPRQRKSCY